MNLQTLQAKAREQFEKSVAKGFVRNEHEQKYFHEAIDTIIASTIKEFGEEVETAIIKSLEPYDDSGWLNPLSKQQLARIIRSLTETV